MGYSTHLTELIGKRPNELSKRMRGPLLAVAALSLFWAWNTCLLFLPVLHPASFDKHTIWLSSGFVTALLYLGAALKPHPIRTLQAKPLMRFACAALMSLATTIQVLLSLPFEQIVSISDTDFSWQALHLIRSLGSVPCAIQLASLLASFTRTRERNAIVFAGAILNPFIYLLIDNLNPPIAGIVTCFLPLLVFACIERPMRQMDFCTTSSTQPSSEHKSTPTTPIAILGSYFVFGLSINFIRGGIEQSSIVDNSNSSIIACTLVLVIIAIMLSLFVTRKMALYSVAAYFTLALFFAIYKLPEFALPLVTAGMFMFTAFFWMSTLNDAQELPGSIIKTFSCGFCSYGFGLALGSTLSHLVPPSSTSVQLLSLLVAYALFLAGTFVTAATRNSTPAPCRQVDASYETATAKSKLERCLEEICNFLADEHDLTPQEKRVLFEISCSKSLKAIAEEFGVSLNTIKTHTSHIYRKIDVHSREELMRAVIERSREVKE